MSANGLAEIETRFDIRYTMRGDTPLVGDLYAPKGGANFPVLVAVHGGGWRAGDRKAYRYIGAFLAQHGIGLFAIQYRLMKPERKSYPDAVNDVRSAVQFVKANAASLGADPARVGLMGDSAGGHLASLAALAGDSPLLVAPGANEPSTKVKVCVSIYGIYDLTAHWEYDLVNRPREGIVSNFLGTALWENRQAYFDASPISHVVAANNATAFFLSWGLEDDIVDPGQSRRFLTALKQAGFFVRSLTIPGAAHFWCSDPLTQANSFSAHMASRLVPFLQEKL